MPAAAVSKRNPDETSSSSDSDSSSEEEPMTIVKSKPETTKKGKAEKPVQEDSDSSDSDSSDDEPAKQTTKTEKKTDAKTDSSSSDSDSSDDDEPKKAKEEPKKVEKKDESEDESSSESSEEEEAEGKKRKVEENEEEEAPMKKHKKEDGTSQPATSENLEIFIQGLPWTATEDELRQAFNACGTITKCNLPLLSDGRSTGTAYITFDNATSYQQALEMNGQELGGRWMKIASADESRKPRNFNEEKPEGCSTVFVGNLAWSVDEDSIRAAFAECGDVKQIRFATDRETGDFRGFGHVEFYSSEAADKAMELAGVDVCGRAIRVSYAQQRNNDRADGGRGGRDFGGRGGGRGRGGRDFGGRGGGRGRGGRDGGRGRGGNFGTKRGIQDFNGKKTTFD